MPAGSGQPFHLPQTGGERELRVKVLYLGMRVFVHTADAPMFLGGAFKQRTVRTTEKRKQKVQCIPALIKPNRVSVVCHFFVFITYSGIFQGVLVGCCLQVDSLLRFIWTFSSFLVCRVIRTSSERHPNVPKGGRRVEAQRVLPRGQRRGVHTAPHAPGGREQAQAHLHPEVFRVRRRDSSDGGVLRVHSEVFV